MNDPEVDQLINQLNADIPEQATAPDDALAPHRRNDYTIGNWATEIDSEAAFDAAIGTGNWTVYPQVWGTLVQPRPHQIDKRVRIDRILTPTSALLAAGWRHGVIGVEIKRSKEKIGPAIAQALDYGRSVWTLHQAGGSLVWLDWVFIWPMPKQSGAMASVCAQNRIGTATPGFHGGIDFKSGEASIASLDSRRGITINLNATNGAKAGRR